LPNRRQIQPDTYGFTDLFEEFISNAPPSRLKAPAMQAMDVVCN
jgi:hypothetical protein